MKASRIVFLLLLLMIDTAARTGFARLFLGAGLFLLICPALGWCQALMITDCQGFTRAVRSAEPGSANRVEVKVESANGAGEGSNVQLTNAATGQVYEAPIVNGMAVFEQVPPGVFSISTAQTGLQLGAISITGVGIGAVTAIGVGVVSVSAGVTGGLVAIDTVADQVDGSSSGGDTPTPEPTTPPIQPTIAPTPIPDDCGECDPDAEPPTLDPFEPDQEEPLSPSR